MEYKYLFAIDFDLWQTGHSRSMPTTLADRL
jgi:hypothetical protein